MTRLTIFIWAVTVVSLVYVQLALAVNVSRLCERRCLYGVGGVLCQCNAMHFKGKRSRPGQDGKPDTVYQKEDSLPSVARVAGTIWGESSNFPNFKRYGATGSTSGSQISYVRSADAPLDLSLDRAWDTTRVNQFIRTLKSLTHQKNEKTSGTVAENGLPIASARDFHSQLFPSHYLYSLPTWANSISDEGEFDKSEKDSFEYSPTSGVSDAHSLRNGNPQSHVDTENGGDFSGKERPGLSLESDDTVTPPGDEANILRLQEVLRQVFRGR